MRASVQFTTIYALGLVGNKNPGKNLEQDPNKILKGSR